MDCRVSFMYIQLQRLKKEGEAMKKRILSLVLAGTLALSLFGCSGGGGGGEGGGGAAQGMYPGTSEAGSIRVECSTMSVMNPILMTYATEFAVARHCWDALVKLDENNQVIGAAAESWESAPNAEGVEDMIWTFHLREGAKWVNSQGEVVGDVTANDFVFAWSELLNPNNAAEYYAFATIFKNAQAYYDYASGVEGAPEVTLDQVGFYAADDYTLVIELENPLPYLLQYLKFEVMTPIYQPFYEEVGAENYGTSPDKLLYNGPFRMTEWTLENSITTVKNDEWYDASNVSLKAIYWDKYTDSNTKLNAFQTGEIDVIDITGEQRAQFEAEGYPVNNWIAGYSYYFYCNNIQEEDLANYPGAKLSDARSINLRKAISYALDRQQIIDTVFKNDNEPSPAFSLGISGVSTETFGEAVVAANNGEPLYNPTADVEKAKEYLALALEDLGYTDASQIKISLLTSEGSQNELFSQVVQEQLRQNLGIEVGIDVVTITEARARRNVKNYDLFMGGWGPDYDDPMSDLDLWTSANGNNHTGYASEEYDALIESTKAESDPAAREQLFVQAELMLAEDMPFIPIYWRHEDYVVSEKVADGLIRLPFQYYNLIYTTLAE